MVFLFTVFLDLAVGQPRTSVSLAPISPAPAGCALLEGPSAKEHVASARRRLICGAPPAPLVAKLAAEAPALLLADDDTVTALVTSLRSLDAATLEQLGRALAARPVAPFHPGLRARDAKLTIAMRDALAASSATKTQLADRLTFELPEHGTATLTTPADRVRRATTLERLHKSDEVIALVGDLVKTDCDAALLVGKSERKRKKYAAARASLKAGQGKACSADQIKRARYLEARVATVQKGAGTTALLSAFIKDYGKDSLVDDVLLWLAEVHTAAGDVDAADKVLRTIITDFPDGDMADDARFRIAMKLAQAGMTDEAVALLDQGIAVLRASSTPRVAELDRARYWAARLSVFPDPSTWEDSKTSSGPWRLIEFAKERPLSFYGHLAGQALKAHGEHIGPSAALPMPAQLVQVPDALATNAAFQLAMRVAQDGYVDDAALLLDDVPKAMFDIESASAIAAVVASVGREDLAHRVLRARGLALLPAMPQTSDDIRTWQLAWPRAYELELSTAATSYGVPPLLMRSIAREESTFDASIVSWAGAVGLCQLMPGTANDEAKALKLPLPSVHDLTDPTLNATLGAAHLGRRLKGLKHPLKAIAAYNAGPGSVLKWLPPKGEKRPIDTWVEAIPFDETRNYVKKVTGSWVTYTGLYGGAPVTYPLDV